MIILSAIFLFIASIYSVVGFGGGSSYIALLIISNQPLYLIPIIALICNIIVVVNGTFRFNSQGHLNLKFIGPFLITSLPMAYIGGRIDIGAFYYQIVLATCLMIAGLHIVSSFKKFGDTVGTTPNSSAALLIGTVLGFISGMVGIGGGIFLSPILYFLGWGNPKKIAASCSFFILVNSVSGLLGQFHKLNEEMNTILNYWPLFLAVLIGGQIGSFTGAVKLNQRPIAIVTGILIVIVSIRLYVNIFL